jgi:hypothetical protein
MPADELVVTPRGYDLTPTLRQSIQTTKHPKTPAGTRVDSDSPLMPATAALRISSGVMAGPR